MPPLQGIDTRNQNIIRSVLESPPPANVSHAEEKVGRKGGGRVFKDYFAGENVLPIVCSGERDNRACGSLQPAEGSRVRRRVGALWDSE